MKRYRPDELIAKYRKIFEEAGEEAFFRDPKHKKTQEMWCAAHFARGYGRHLGPCFVHISDEDEQTDADFELEVNGHLFPFQVTELMEPGRRRGDEYRGGSSGRSRLEDWSNGTEHGPSWVREAIERKRRKRYSDAANLNLLVYVNFLAYEQQYESIRVECESLANKFAAVWLLNGNGISCIKASSAFPLTGGWAFIEESPAKC